MHTKLITTLALVFSFLATPAAALAEALPGNPPAHAQNAARVSAPRGVSLGSRDEDQRYASQEAKSSDAKKYRGGDVIVISATALIVVLLVVIILILI
jgi:hypothetical protein